MRSLLALPIVFSLAACGDEERTLSDGGTLMDTGVHADAGPCVVSEVQAGRVCEGDEVFWSDDCGGRGERIKGCAGSGCSAGACVERAWFGLGESEFGPRDTVVRWGSASGYGVTGGFVYQANEPALALDPTTGHPVIAFDDADGVSTRVRVFRWDGERFVELGTSPSGGFGAAGTAGRTPALAIDGSGTPLLAWSQLGAGGDWQVLYKQWNGSAWVELAGSGSGNGISNDPGSIPPKIALDDMDRPMLVWQNNSSLRLRRWDGAAWVGVGSSGTGSNWTGSNERLFAPSIASDSAGRPQVAFCETATGAKVRVWNGTFWDSIGDTLGSACNETAIAVGAADHPIVAWIGAGDVYVRRWTGTRWEELDGSGSAEGVSNSGGTAYEMSLALMSNGDPVVSWRGAGDGGLINEFSVYLRRWNGVEWVELAGSASGDGISRDPRATIGADLAIGADDAPFVVWEVHAQYPATTSLVHLRTFDGADWIELGASPPNKGGISNTYAGARGPSIALDAQRRPAVAWFDQTDEEGFPQILLRRWDGSTWAELAGSGTGRGISDAPQVSYYPSLALEPGSDNPVVAWSQSYDPSGNSEMYLRRWSGSAWVELAGSATAGGISATPERSASALLAFDGDAAPVISWVDQTDTGYVTLLRRFDGQSWAELDGSGHGFGLNGDGGVQALGVDKSGAPIVAWAGEKHFHVRRWDGTSWARFANDGFDTAPDEVFSFEMAVGPNDEIAAVWTANISQDNTEVRARVWDGSTWRSLAGSATGAGLSANEGRAGDVAVTFDGDGRAIVAWNDQTNGNDEIYLRRWDGFRWEEVLGSASGGGVSNSDNDSEGVDLDFRDGRLCVTYGELGAYGQQIIVRCVDFERD